MWCLILLFPVTFVSFFSIFFFLLEKFSWSQTDSVTVTHLLSKYPANRRSTFGVERVAHESVDITTNNAQKPYILCVVYQPFTEKLELFSEPNTTVNPPIRIKNSINFAKNYNTLTRKNKAEAFFMDNSAHKDNSGEVDILNSPRPRISTSYTCEWVRLATSKK